jgi:ERCC4-related helicase
MIILEDSDTDNDGDDKNHLKLILKEETYLQKAKELYTLFASDSYKNRFDWIRSEFFANSLQQNLIFIKNDSKEIIKILNIGKDWNPDEDRQLNALYDLLTKTHSKEKVLVFTQFADTAYYLTEQLKKEASHKLKV